MLQQINAQRMMNKTGPVAFIGDIIDEVCQPMGTVGSLLDAVVISPGCRDPVFAQSTCAVTVTAPGHDLTLCDDLHRTDCVSDVWSYNQ